MEVHGGSSEGSGYFGAVDNCVQEWFACRADPRQLKIIDVVDLLKSPPPLPAATARKGLRFRKKALRLKALRRRGVRPNLPLSRAYRPRRSCT